jgi:DNA repair exonuclease SbcCD ATPase subunit
MKQQKLRMSVEKFKDLEEKEKRKQTLTEELSVLEKQIALSKEKFKERDIREIRKEFTDVISRVTELNTRIESLNDLISEKEKIKVEYEKKMQEIEKEKNEIEKLEKLIDDLKIFENALEKTQTQLRENFVDTVNYTMDQMWADIYPYADFISAKLAIEDRDYVLQVQKKSGEWTDVDGVVSGGEKSIASLVLRIAFSSVLAPQLRWLVLDEPTHNLDTKAVEDLSETLRARVTDFADQVFLITHEKILENAVTGQLYRLTRDKELDDVTKIERVN